LSVRALFGIHEGETDRAGSISPPFDRSNKNIILF